jgi:hypothetical protein
MLRNLAGHYAHAEYAAFRTLLVRGLGLFLIVSTLISTAMWVLSTIIASQLFKKPELTSILQILAFSIVPFSLLQLLGEGLRAVGQTVLSSLTQGPCPRDGFGNPEGRERDGYLCAGTEASTSSPLVTSSTTALPDGIPAAVLPAVLMRDSEFLH